MVVLMERKIDASAPYAPTEAQRKGIQKHQAVFSLDFETWEQLIEVFGIEKSIIPHRKETEETGQTWYGAGQDRAQPN